MGMKTLFSHPANHWVMGIYIIINVGLYYPQFLTLISVSYLVLFVGFMVDISHNNNSNITDYVKDIFLFMLYSAISLLWADDPQYGISNYIELIKMVIPAIFVAKLIHTKDDFVFAIKLLAIACLIYSFFFISLIDVSQLVYSRIDDLLDDEDSFAPNVNIVSLCSSFACLIFVSLGLIENKLLYYVLALTSFVLTVILGSRKSLLAVILYFLLVIYKSKSDNRIYFMGVGAIVLVFTFVPLEYLEFVFDRFGIFDFFLSNNSNVVDESDEERLKLIDYGIRFFLDSPLFGNGFYNYPALYHSCGFGYIYAHNNYLEILADLGIIGFILYYKPYYSISLNVRKNLDNKWNFYIGTFLLVILFNSFFIVMITMRFVWLLLSILYVGCKLYIKEEK